MDFKKKKLTLLISLYMYYVCVQLRWKLGYYNNAKVCVCVCVCVCVIQGRGHGFKKIRSNWQLREDRENWL